MGRLSTVLVVDDNRISRMMLRENLQDLGLTVLEASDGAEAIERIKEELPGLVLSDILMPGCDGFDILAYPREG